MRAPGRQSSKIDSSEYGDLSRVIGWFIRLRWMACGGVLATLLLVQLRFRYPLPYPLLYLLTGLLCLSNSAFTVYFHLLKQRALARREISGFLHLQIWFDYAFLLFLVYLTGFLENPFSYFFVFHILLTSFIFPSHVTYRYVGGLILALLAVFLAEHSRLIPHYSLSPSGSSSYFDLFVPRAVGLCATLAICAYLITSIKERIEEKGRKIEVELNRYKNLDKIKSNFILQVTHELRGPLAAMNGYHEMILRGLTGAVGEKTVQTLRRANRRTENLLTIIDEMLDYAYMNSDQKARYGRTVLALRPIIDEALEALAPLASQKEIRLSAGCGRELKLLANRDLLNIILGNLVNNAIKYSPPDTTVRVTAVEEDGEVHLQVQDEGYGIEPQEMEAIFEEFYRSRKARELERDGTGLGLSIVKRAVESLNGRLSLYSQVDRGTTFHIHLPKGET